MHNNKKKVLKEVTYEKKYFKKLMTAILGFMFVLGITNYFNVQNVYASENVEFTVSVDSAKVKPGDNITYTVKMSGNDSGVVESPLTKWYISTNKI